jgi:hypothetical protein
MSVTAWRGRADANVTRFFSGDDDGARVLRFDRSAFCDKRLKYSLK